MSVDSRVRCWALALALVGAWHGVARAQSADSKVAAEALFDDARKAMDAGKYDVACAKFEQSQRLDPGIGTLLYLADCYEKSGRIASAWATFREGASQAKAAGQSERADAGEDRAKRLEPRLSRLTVNVASANTALEGIVIRRGGTVIAKELWGVALPVDGGEIDIEASAPKAKAWSKRVTVKAEQDSVTVEVPALEAEASPVAAPEPAPMPAPTVAPVTPPAPAEDRETAGETQRTIGLVLGGVGLVGVGFGSYFGLRAISKNSDAKELCDGSVCHDRRGVELTDDARSSATISSVAFGVGLSALVAGGVLYFTAPSPAEPAPSASRPRLQLRPALGPHAGALFLGGRF